MTLLPTVRDVVSLGGRGIGEAPGSRWVTQKLTAEEPNALRWTHVLEFERYNNLKAVEQQSFWLTRPMRGAYSNEELEKLCVCDGAQLQRSGEMRGGTSAGRLSDAAWLADLLVR